MAIADRAARKLLQAGGGAAAVARGVATFSFGLDGLWELISGFFADILAHIVAALAGLVHLLVLPFEALWHLLVAAVAGAAGAVTSGLNSLWHLVTGFFPNLFAALAGAAHNLLVLPFEALWHWLVAAVAGAGSAITSGLAGLWHLIAGFFPRLFAALTGAAHNLVVLPIEAFWHWLAAAVSSTEGAISSGLGSLWHLFAGFFAHLFAALAAAVHNLLVLPIEALWHWVQSAATATLHLVLGAAAVLLVVALICCFGPAIYAATVRVCRALVLAACCLAHGLYFAGAGAVGRRVSFFPPPRRQQQAAAQRQQDDEEEESFLGAVDTAAWGPEEAVVDSGDVHHAWHIRTKGLDERAIAAIGTVVYDASKEQHQELSLCTYCQAEFGDGDELRLLPPCGHAFHRGCIDTWLGGHIDCPNCRAPVKFHTTDAANAPTEEAERARRTRRGLWPASWLDRFRLAGGSASFGGGQRR